MIFLTMYTKWTVLKCFEVNELLHMYSCCIILLWPVKMVEDHKTESRPEGLHTSEEACGPSFGGKEMSIVLLLNGRFIEVCTTDPK